MTSHDGHPENVAYSNPFWQGNFVGKSDQLEGEKYHFFPQDFFLSLNGPSNSWIHGWIPGYSLQLRRIVCLDGGFKYFLFSPVPTRAQRSPARGILCCPSGHKHHARHLLLRAIADSPTWHRRQRAQRSKAPTFLNCWCAKTSASVTARVLKATQILEAHHTKPKLRQVRRHMEWRSWNLWEGGGKGGGRKGGRGGQQKGHQQQGKQEKGKSKLDKETRDRPREEAPSFPTYECMPLSSSLAAKEFCWRPERVLCLHRSVWGKLPRVTAMLSKSMALIGLHWFWRNSPAEQPVEMPSMYRTMVEPFAIDFTGLHCIGRDPETNIAPENSPSQKETNIPTTNFQVLC